jgi:hypothetical protein
MKATATITIATTHITVIRIDAGGTAQDACQAGGDRAAVEVIQTVREKSSCRECETIMQPPALFHVTPRGLAGSNLLAMILFEKFGQHQPLNRSTGKASGIGAKASI